MNVAFDPGHICAETVRERVLIESWDYPEADTQKLTHNIHRYSGKFIPQIAERAIKILTKPSDLVLDPYCGSGTVLIESLLLKRRALGVDLSPLAVLIAQAKTTPVPLVIRNSLKTALGMVVQQIEDDGQLSFWQTQASVARTDARLSDGWFCKWFTPEVLNDLVILHSSIIKIEDCGARNLALVAFSDILRRSSNAHSGYPNVMFDKNARPRTKPGRTFLKTLDRICEMVGELEDVPADWRSVQAQLGDAAAIQTPSGSVDAVITHPPYIGSIPYAEYGLLSLKWLGCDPKALDQKLTGGRRQSADVVIRFRDSYLAMFREVVRVLRTGGFAFFMVGNPVVKGELIDLANMTRQLAQAAGLSFVVETKRTGINRRANKMGDESLLFFQKEGP